MVTHAPIIFMFDFVQKIARSSAIIGGIALTILAICMTISIFGGAISKLGYSDWLQANFPSIAAFIQDTGIRTIVGMYEIAKLGIAFVIFAFLPITTFDRAHAVVDIFTNSLPPRINQFLITFWEIVFFVVLAIITWRLYFGMERLMSSNMMSQDLKIPDWYGYLVAFIQMIIATAVSAYVVWLQILKLFTGEDHLSSSDGAVH